MIRVEPTLPVAASSSPPHLRGGEGCDISIGFLSITFAFSDYSRSVEARNCRSDRRETGTQIGQIGKTENRIGYPLVFFPKTGNQMLKNGVFANCNEHQTEKLI